MTDFEQTVLADLSALKAQVNALLGVGQPGRLNALEERVEEHERSVQRMKGVGGLVGALLTMLHIFVDVMHKQ